MILSYEYVIVCSTIFCLYVICYECSPAEATMVSLCDARQGVSALTRFNTGIEGARNALVKRAQARKQSDEAVVFMVLDKSK